MSQAQQIQAAPANSWKMLRAMVGIGILCALLIVLTFEGTLPRIEKNKAEALEKAIFQVVPGITKKKTFQVTADNQIAELKGEGATGQLIYAGYNDQNELVGLAIEAAGMGYADVIRILYGYDPEKQVVFGFNVMESKETPGLGDKIEKDPRFTANFEALDVSLDAAMQSVENKVVAVKHGEKENPWEIDGITGATISSRAIGNILATSTEQLLPVIHDHIEAFKYE